MSTLNRDSFRKWAQAYIAGSLEAVAASRRLLDQSRGLDRHLRFIPPVDFPVYRMDAALQAEVDRVLARVCNTFKG